MPDQRGFTALMIAAAYNRLEAVKLLLESGAMTHLGNGVCNKVLATLFYINVYAVWTERFNCS